MVISTKIEAQRLDQLSEMLEKELEDHPMGNHNPIRVVSTRELLELVRGYREPNSLPAKT